MSTDGRTTRPSDELLAHPNEKPQQNRPSVGARGFEPLSPSAEELARSKHNTEAGRPSPYSELLASCGWILNGESHVHTHQGSDQVSSWVSTCAKSGCCPCAATPSGDHTVSLSPSERSEDANPEECYVWTSVDGRCINCGQPDAAHEDDQSLASPAGDGTKLTTARPMSEPEVRE